MILGASLIYPFQWVIADVFAEDPNILYETVLFLQTLLPTLPFFGLFISAMSTGRGSGHTIFPTALDIMRHWAIRIALGYFLTFSFGMGSLGIWLAFSLSNVVAGTVSILWIKYGNWAEAVIQKNPT